MAAAFPSLSSTAAVVGAPPARRKLRPDVTSPETFFITPDVVAANTPTALAAEAVRRVEIFLLRTIHELVSVPRPADPPSLSEERLRVTRLQLLVLCLLYENLHRGVISTQRDVYYRLARFVPDQTVVNRTIQQLVQLLGIPRQWLGVVPGTRGCVGGSLSFHGVDLRLHGSEGLPLPTTQEELRVTRRGVDGTIGAAEDSPNGFELHGQTRYIIVIEKHAVFFRLMEERIFDRVPCVLLTSHGFPTVTARTLLSNLHRAATDVPVVALVDYNPSGLSILQQYKYSAGGMCEGQYAAVPALHWLGVRSCHITHTPDPNGVAPHSAMAASSTLRLLPRLPFQPFSRRDAVMMTNHVARWRGLCEKSVGADGGALKAWCAEVERMQLLRVKVELEALYEHAADASGHGTSLSLGLSDCCDFSAWVCRGLFRRDYI